VWHYWTFEELKRSFYPFASGIVPSILQIDLKCKTNFISSGINEYINTIAFGLILIILYSCDSIKDSKAQLLIKSSRLALFLLDFKSISNEKLALNRLGIRTISIEPHLVKNKEHFNRVTLPNVWGAESFVITVSIWHCSLHTSNRFQMKNILYSGWD
jgi:hypothetical protein